MATEVIGKSPVRLPRVGICRNPECEESGVPVEVPLTQMTYTCSCGEIVDTMLFNEEFHLKSELELRKDRDETINETLRWCYAPQLALDKDDGEPL